MISFIHKIKKELGNGYSSIIREVRYIKGYSMRGSYQIAFRSIQNGGIMNDEKGVFHMIPNLRQGFSADPFLFKYNDDIYLFAELMNDRRGKGEIGFCKWNGKGFSRWKVIICEDWHLSYPLVFELENGIYMIPEAGESKSLYMYKATRFPDKWEKQAPILAGKNLKDTTVFSYGNKQYAFSSLYKENNLCLFLMKFDETMKNVISIKEISDDKSISRCGGNVFQNGDHYVRVAQDCSKVYGERLIFLKFEIDSYENISEKICKIISAKDILIDKKMKISRIHTYNVCGNVEVIDLF